MKSLTNLFKQVIPIVFAMTSIISCTEGNKSNSTEIQATLEEYKKKIDSLEQENKILKESSNPLGITTTNIKKPNHIIQSDFAQKIYHLYDNREQLINKVVRKNSEGNDFNATRSLFYDIDDLFDYLVYIKKLSKKAEVQPSGLRFYFALYADDYIRNGEDKKYAKRQTFFIAPTTEVKDDKGNIEHLGYTLDNNFKVELLQEKIRLDRRLSEDGKLYQKAGFFNFSTNTAFIEENSLIANEFTGTPPKGN